MVAGPDPSRNNFNGTGIAVSSITLVAGRPMPFAKEEHEQRLKFIRHFSHFGSILRFPLPYSGFSGRPNGEHDNFKFDEKGFRNLGKSSYDPNGFWPRVFVLGGSTMVEGDSEDDTVPGRLQSSLRQAGYHDAQVFNFGVVSTCFKQMSALAWSHLADLRPDALVVVGGGTDVTNPWTFDPRPGHPYNAFVIEQVYDFLFDPSRIYSRELGLSYDELTSLLYARLERVRAETSWRTTEWEHAVVESTCKAVQGFSSLALALQVPVFCILQPTIVRKKHLALAERNSGSSEFIAYLDRQYGRLEKHFDDLSKINKTNRNYFALSLSDKFSNETEQIFYDAAHYIAKGRQMVADDLSEKLSQVLDSDTRSRAVWTVALQRLRSWL